MTDEQDTRNPPKETSTSGLFAILSANIMGLAQFVGVVIGGTLAWAALSNRVERVESSHAQTQQSLIQIRDDIRDEGNRTDNRIRELDRSREEHAKSLVRLEGRLDSMEKTMDRVDKTTTIILDRLSDSPAASRRGPVAATHP